MNVFFGKTQQADCQNDPPTVPTFLLLHETLSLYSLLKFLMFRNCLVVEEEKPILDTPNFRSFFLFHTGNQNDHIDFVAEVKKRLDAFILQDDWECGQIVTALSSSVPEVSDYIITHMDSSAKKR